jgi:hypothetical protein
VGYLLNMVCSQSLTATPVNQQITTESPPAKYNLMEEIYGVKWSESPADMYLSSADCTIGTVPVQLSGHPLIGPTRLSGHLKGCTRSAPSWENWEKLLGGLNSINTILAIQMGMNSFSNE